MKQPTVASIGIELKPTTDRIDSITLGLNGQLVIFQRRVFRTNFYLDSLVSVKFLNFSSDICYYR